MSRGGDGLATGRLRRDKGLRQIKREGASRARGAGQTNLAAEQARNFPADGQSEPGAAEFAAGAAVSLLKCLEDDPLFVRRNADAGVAHGKGHDRSGATERFVVRTPTPGRGGRLQ